MALIDISLELNLDNQITMILWNSKVLEQTYSAIWNLFVGHALTEMLPLDPLLEEGTFLWEKEHFSYMKHVNSQGDAFLFLKKEHYKEFLYEQALNHIPEGIQIYDENACAVFYNSCSKKLSSIPNNIVIEGKHLLDLYDYPKEISTVITSLNTKAPVINRTWSFKTATGSLLHTANSAYPIFKDKKLIGSITYEQDISIAQNYIAAMKKIQKSLTETDQSEMSGNFSGYSFNHIIGKGEKLQSAIRLARRVAPQDCTILLCGETGTGKEIFAQSIHKVSSRKKKKFLAINCAAIPDTLIESLLFGTKKGSFTGSVDQAGYFEEVNGGTLFLDELNSMSLSMQSKLLRVFQEGTFRRVGGTKDLPLDVRIISSCNENPHHLIESNLFRKDFFYRMSTITINLPPLREHIGDLEELIWYYIQQNSYKYAKTIRHISPDVLTLLASYDWPGNIRELFHTLDYVLNVMDDDTIRLEYLPEGVFKNIPVKSENTAIQEQSFTHQNLQKTMDDFECKVLLQTLEYHGYNITRAAEELGLHRQGMQYRIKKYGIIF